MVMAMNLLSVARQAKHSAFLFGKKYKLVKIANAIYRLQDSLVKYEFDPTRYPGSFLQSTAQPGQMLPVPNVIYVFWTGSNALTPARSRNLDLMRRRNPGTELILVTPENLADFVKPEAPLHPAYPHLSLVHRSDYLRCYFMHHYGGGYSDIKEPKGRWWPAIEKLQRSPDAYGLGYREVSSDMCAQLDGRIGRHLRARYRRLIGMGAFIMRPQTPLTEEWHRETLALLDRKANDLEKNPGNIRGDNRGYPIHWTGLLGDILQPVSLKYSDHLIIDESIRPSFHNYR